MRYLYYTNYQSGHSGLSNGIMSVEVGAVLAHLTNRLLVLDGNVSPPANIVAYDGRVSNRRPSRVTDLLDVPVPWVEPNAVDLQGLESLELTNLSLGQFAFYFPHTLDLSSRDARCFARGRDQWVTATDAHHRVPVLRLSEDPLVPGTRDHRTNLSCYSYQFYLNDETRRSVYRLLQRMQPKRPFVELAERVARDIGPFNAVHLRRGDFKVTYGVTTLDRKPHEAIEAMDEVFSRADALVIVTDERDDPFFEEIKLAYPRHYFIDWHILDHYAEEFALLPQSDSLSLACLSQLVAAEAKEFVGTMTSTFTGMIQRYRGNRGKAEAFRYLWNEVPEPGQGFERGRHAFSNCIALDRGVMVEQFAGPYAWNRVSQLLNPAWMREWPESFLTPEALATGVLATGLDGGANEVVSYAAVAARQPVIYVTFENIQVAVWSDDDALLQRLAPDLGARAGTPASNVIANLEIAVTAAACWIEHRGRSEKTVCEEAQLPLLLKRHIATILAVARHPYTWLEAVALAKAGQGIVIAGSADSIDHSLLGALGDSGWELLDGGLFAIRSEDLMILPLGARAQPEGAAAQPGRIPTPFARLVFTARAPLHAQDVIVAMPPASAVAALIGVALDFKIARHRAVDRLCRLVERRSAARLHWSRPREAAQLITRWADAAPAVSA